jgi:hypothetical protein
MTTKQAASNVGAELAKVVSDVAEFTTMEKTEAGKLLTTARGIKDAQAALEKSKGGFWKAVVKAFSKGCTVAGLLAAEPELGDLGAFTSAVSTVNGAKKYNVPLMENGKVRGKSEVGKAIAAARKVEKSGEPSDKVEGPVTAEAHSNVAHVLTDDELCAAVFARLLADTKAGEVLRQRYAQDCSAVVKMFQDDESERAKGAKLDAKRKARATAAKQAVQASDDVSAESTDTADIPAEIMESAAEAMAA